MNFLEKKKPAPRLYCDICEEFDAHDTEECPTQSSQSDLPAPTKDKKNRKLPPPRSYCDHCEGKSSFLLIRIEIKKYFSSTVFDLHETEDCPHGEEETY